MDIEQPLVTEGTPDNDHNSDGPEDGVNYRKHPEKYAENDEIGRIEKREAAKVFKRRGDQIRQDDRYQRLKEEFQNSAE